MPLFCWDNKDRDHRLDWDYGLSKLIRIVAFFVVR